MATEEFFYCEIQLTHSLLLLISWDRQEIKLESEKAFVGPQWDNSVDHIADTWADQAVGWIKIIQNGTVIFYERLLLEDTAAELKSLLSVINFIDPHHPPVDPERMRCTLLHKIAQIVSDPRNSWYHSHPATV